MTEPYMRGNAASFRLFKKWPAKWREYPAVECMPKGTQFEFAIA